MLRTKVFFVIVWRWLAIGGFRIQDCHGFPYMGREALKLHWSIQNRSCTFNVAMFLIHGQAGRSIASHAGVFRGDRFSSLPSKFCPGISFTIFINQFKLPKNNRDGLNPVSISVWIFRPEKQENLFRCSVAPGNFLMERSKKSRLRGRRSRAQILPAPSPDPLLLLTQTLPRSLQKVVFHLLSILIFRKILVIGKQPHALTHARLMCHANIKLEGGDQKLGRYFFCFCSL